MSIINRINAATLAELAAGIPEDYSMIDLEGIADPIKRWLCFHARGKSCELRTGTISDGSEYLAIAEHRVVRDGDSLRDIGCSSILVRYKGILKTSCSCPEMGRSPGIEKRFGYEEQQ